jgi:hypothetical protein
MWHEEPSSAVALQLGGMWLEWQLRLRGAPARESEVAALCAPCAVATALLPLARLWELQPRWFSISLVHGHTQKWRQVLCDTRSPHLQWYCSSAACDSSGSSSSVGHPPAKVKLRPSAHHAQSQLLRSLSRGCWSLSHDAHQQQLCSLLCGCGSFGDHTWLLRLRSNPRGSEPSPTVCSSLDGGGHYFPEYKHGTT